MANLTSVDPVNSMAYVTGALDLFVYDIDGTYTTTNGIKLNLPAGYVSINNAGVATLNVACASEVFVKKGTAGPELHFITSAGAEVASGVAIKATVYVAAKKGVL